jgi:hypothetical protein
MSESENVEKRVRSYFSVKRRQLLAMRDLPVCEHPGLIGGHREELQRVYFKEILPERFRIGRGMVYGPYHRSREADIVIWDAFNYPCLPMLDHSFFFSESVRAVVECKSNWSSENLEDVMIKTRAVRGIVAPSRPNLDHELRMLHLKIAALQLGQAECGLMTEKPRIGTSAIFLSGGQTFLGKFQEFVQLDEVDEAWPDVCVLLEPGHVILKRYEIIENQFMGGRGWLELYEAGEDSLLIFTSALLSMMTERTVQVEDPLDIWQYTHGLRSLRPVAPISFPLTTSVPQVNELWPRQMPYPVPEQ